jgi:predicted nucleic acid-binding protein
VSRHRSVQFTVDSNYMIYFLQSWSPHHQATIADLQERLTRGDTFYIIPHTLLEVFSVLTRIPAPLRSSAMEAHSLLRKNFGEFHLTEQPGPQQVWNLLAHLAATGIGGGRTYDSWIAWSAQNAGIQEFVTWNARHFPAGSFGKLRIIEPSES